MSRPPTSVDGPGASAPGSTLGVLGSGQLGRMLALAARRMGYRVHVLSPGDDTPTGQVADLEVDADYEDLDAVRAFAGGVDVVTFEFENVPPHAPTRPPSRRRCARPTGCSTPPSTGCARRRSSPAPACRWRRSPVRSLDELDADGRRTAVGAPAVLKTAGFGYDGKGQAVIETAGRRRGRVA